MCGGPHDTTLNMHVGGAAVWKRPFNEPAVRLPVARMRIGKRLSNIETTSEIKTRLRWVRSRSPNYYDHRWVVIY